MSEGHERPRFPQMSLLQDRISTYTTWPESSFQIPEVLASAGFFYVGYNDYTKCFCCGGGLQNWEPDDNPWVEHARWFPTCRYLIENKGSKFVKMVQRTMDIKDPGEAFQSSPADQQSIENSIFKGHFYEDPIDKEALRCFYTGYNDYTRCFFWDGDLRHWESEDDPRDADAQRRQNEGLMFVGSVYTEKDIQQREETEPFMPTENQSQNDQAAQDVAALLDEHRRLKMGLTCKGCFRRRVNVVLCPCSHAACCRQCLLSTRKCPVCRQYIDGTVTIHI